MRHLIKPTLLLTSFTIIGQVISFIVNIISAKLFGASIEMDAYLAAQTLPTYVNTVLVGGLGFVFIPIFIENKTKKDEKAAWDIASSTISLYTIILCVISVFGLVFSRQILAIIVPGLPENTISIAVNLSLILWPTAIISGLLAILASLYQASERFIYHALTTLIASTVYLLILTVGGGMYGIYILAIGTLLSSLLQVILLIKIIRQKYSFKINLTPEVLGLMKLQMPIIVAALFGQFSKIIDRFIASGMLVGSISYLAYADKIKALTAAILGSGIAITIFPSIIRNLSENNLFEFKRNISFGLKITWLLLAPAVCFGSFLSLPLVSILFERSAFHHTDSIAVSSILPFYLISVVGATLGNISSRAIYALKKTNIIAATDIVGTILYAVYAPILGQHFGIVGIGISIMFLWNLGFMAHCICLWFILKRPSIRSLTIYFMRVFIIAVVSSLIISMLYKMKPDLGIAYFVAISSLGLILYGIGLYMMKINEFIQLTKILKGKMFNRPLTNAVEE